MEPAISLISESEAFLQFLDGWIKTLPEFNLDAGFSHPERTAILSVDVIEGFCSQGALASPRVGQIVVPIVRLLREAWGAGLRQIVLMQDTHEPEAVEFAAWPAHCVRGSEESQAVAAIRELPFFDRIMYSPRIPFLLS
jgi:Amidases related to nicotinamidase